MSFVRRTVILFSLLALGLGAAQAQTRRKAQEKKPKPGEPKFEVTVRAATGKEAERLLRENERLGARRRKYNEADEKCRELLKARLFKGAELACKSAAGLADRLEPGSTVERISANEAAGEALLGQQRYQEALEYYSRALELGRPRYTEEDGTLGRLYANLAMTNHLLGDLGRARQMYRKAEQIYRAVYSGFGDGPLDKWEENYRQGYLDRLKLILEYHRKAAAEAGATSEVEEVEKLLDSLP